MKRSWLLVISLAACSDTGTATRPGGMGGGDDSGGGDDGGGGADAPGSTDEPANLAGITMLHNQARAAVQTSTPLPSLAWDPKLAQIAATWAAKCVDVEAPAGLVDHDPDRTTGSGYAYVGENIFGSGGTATASMAMQSWMSEAADYNYAANTCSGVCGHYTQIVWRDTTHVGCALYDCAGLTYGSTIVCDYGPGGNVNGERPY